MCTPRILAHTLLRGPCKQDWKHEARRAVVSLALCRCQTRDARFLAHTYLPTQHVGSASHCGHGNLLAGKLLHVVPLYVGPVVLYHGAGKAHLDSKLPAKFRPTRACNKRAARPSGYAPNDGIYEFVQYVDFAHSDHVRGWPDTFEVETPGVDRLHDCWLPVLCNARMLSFLGWSEYVLELEHVVTQFHTNPESPPRTTTCGSVSFTRTSLWQPTRPMTYYVCAHRPRPGPC